MHRLRMPRQVSREDRQVRPPHHRPQILIGES